MSDFGWDLQAVVRGCNMSMEEEYDPHTCFSPLMSYQCYQLQEEEDDLIFGKVVFPEYLFADTSSSAVNNNNLDLDLLEDLYKPFYPHNSFSLSTNNSLEKVSDSALDQNLINHHHVGTDHDHDQCSKAVVGAKYRRRKNQHKRVVMEVTAEGLSSDMWAWRKYGQKPIKGSPYPRSYYRCSSSRGCPARKQVERSHNSEIPTTNFIITYTAEHNHSKPTRRNSLAGTTRQRFSNSNTTTTTPTAATAEKNNITTSEDTKKRMILKKKKKKTEEEVKLINDEEEVIITSYEHPVAAAAAMAMMIMNDDFLGADFEDAQLNISPSSSSHLQFHQAQAQAHHTTTTNFW